MFGRKPKGYWLMARVDDEDVPVILYEGATDKVFVNPAQQEADKPEFDDEETARAVLELLRRNAPENVTMRLTRKSARKRSPRVVPLFVVRKSDLACTVRDGHPPLAGLPTATVRRPTA